MFGRLLPQEGRFFELFIAHEVIELLHKTFITPIDRDDIHQLITRMDDILDLIEEAAQSVYLYHLRVITPEAARLAEICVACGEKVREAVSLLPKMDNAPQMRAACREITKLRPVGGFCAETGGAITLFLATGPGIPVSTTHTITGAIVGVGSVQKLSAVRWGVAGSIVWAWVLTIPASAFIAAIAWWLGRHFL